MLGPYVQIACTRYSWPCDFNSSGGFGFPHRGAYASGTVFTASMLDTLLPQMYNKRPADILSVFELLIGLRSMSATDATEARSGLLAQVEVTP